MLPRNREKLIDGIANAIETQWLTPEMVRDKLKKLELADRLGRFLETASLEQTLGRPQLISLCEGIAGTLDSETFRRFIEDSIRAHAPTSVRIANSIGLVNYGFARSKRASTPSARRCDRGRARPMKPPID